MSAGPNSIHDRIRQAYARQVLYHYDPSFHELFDDTTEKLMKVYQTSGDVVIMQGEAVLGLEAASACAVRPGDKCLNLVSGVFGAGYARYFRRYSGQDPHEIKVPYNESIAVEDVEKVLKREGDIRAIAVVHSETPSGTLNPVKEICALAQEYGALTIVDAVSSFSGLPVPVDEWGVDICVAGPHKCLGAAPGSALMSVSDRAWEAMRAHPKPLRKGYLSLLDWKELWMEQRRFPFTIFVAQINAVNEALTMVLEEGLEARFARHAHAANMCRAGIEALGLRLWPARAEIMASCVTAFMAPNGVTPTQILDHMRGNYGIAITGSLKELADKVVRIGHMGHMARPVYVEMALAALERTLFDLGHPVKLGSAVGAASAVM
jgi:pyridoxamine--pyruvate transaminase|tara:strand:- start:5405 stop:6538 length:1134 start_codon:yes stop_codon:yes gene_type:complete